MQYINLINELTKEDKNTLVNYISLYGVDKNKFIGLDEWLQNWSHSKQRLYKMLGNQFTVEYEYDYEKDNKILTIELNELLLNHSFPAHFKQFLNELLFEDSNIDTVKTELFQLSKIFDLEVFLTNSFSYTIKYKEPGKKMLQIQQGSKPLKVIYRVMEYFKDKYFFDMKLFEDFKTQYSLILNDKVIKGTMVISILPLDFLTMSDNASNWNSCMSWTENGCYHLGTVEMMNSNNVVCCYLKDNKHYYNFKAKNPSKNYETPKEYTWNNKIWRNLFYITKDIIMGGKSYPYEQDDFTKFLLEKIKDLVYKNLHWSYNYGPELYKDMNHIYSNTAMNNNRNWLSYKNTFKHNIIWDTKGMYNDMLNTCQHGIKYWCYRNKVKQTKIISVSGKSNCLCCGEDNILYDNENNYYNDYNDRFLNSGSTICEKCLDKYFTCCLCNCHCPTENFYITKSNGEEICLCKKCFQTYVKICPDCGKPFVIEDYIHYTSDLLRKGSIANEDKYKTKFVLVKNHILTNMQGIDQEFYVRSLSQEATAKEIDVTKDTSSTSFRQLFACPECKAKLYSQIKWSNKEYMYKTWGYYDFKQTYKYIKYIIKIKYIDYNEDIQKYLFPYLKEPDRSYIEKYENFKNLFKNF